MWSVFIMTYEDECMCFLAFFEQQWLYTKSNLLAWPSLLWKRWKKNAKNKVAAHTSILIKSTDSVPLFINFARSRLVHISAQLGPNLHQEIISCSERMKWTSEWGPFDGCGLTGSGSVDVWLSSGPWKLCLFNWGTWKQWAASSFCKWGNQDLPQTLLVFIWMLQ